MSRIEPASSLAGAERRAQADPTRATRPNANADRTRNSAIALSSPALALANVVSRLRVRLPYLTVKRIKVFLAGVTCLLVIASAVTSYFITQRQNALKQVSRYNLTFVASLAPVEVTRLEAAILESTLSGSGVDQDQVQLRLDIVRNRIGLLDNSELADFIREHADLGATVARLRSMVEEAQPLIDDLGHGTTVSQLLKLVSPLGPQLVRLAVAANSHDADLVVCDQAQLSRLHTIFSVIIAGLTIAQ